MTRSMSVNGRSSQTPTPFESSPAYDFSQRMMMPGVDDNGLSQRQAERRSEDTLAIDDGSRHLGFEHIRDILARLRG